MKLPTFGEAEKAVINKTDTPLDRFIHIWGPPGAGYGERFRNDLGALLEWARSSCSMTPSEIEEAIANLPRHKDHPIPDVERLDRAITFNSFWNPTTGLYENANLSGPKGPRPESCSEL